MPRVGDPLVLSALLEYQETDLYVRAIVTDADNLPLAISPVSMPHLGSGLYKNATYPYPDTEYAIAVYEVFEDAAFTIPATYFAGGACFEKDIGADAIIEEINTHTTDQVNRVVFCEIEAVIEQNEISVTLCDNEVIVKVDEDEIGVLTDENSISATINADCIDTDIEDDALEATLEC